MRADWHLSQPTACQSLWPSFGRSLSQDSSPSERMSLLQHSFDHISPLQVDKSCQRGCEVKHYTRILALFFAASGFASSQTLDYVISASGPHYVVQGHYIFFQVNGSVLHGTDQPATPSVSGLPGAATASWPDLKKFCCGSFLYRISGSTTVKINTSSSTPVGTYVLRITYTSQSGVVRTTSFRLYVDRLRSLPAVSRYPAFVPLASVAQWEENMTHFGRAHCTAVEMAGMYQGWVWYYDGERVYYQIADYTGDKALWEPCALMVQANYRGYVLANTNSSGAADIPGYKVFAKGLALNVRRTGDPVSKEAVAALANSPYAALGNAGNSVSATNLISWRTSRETAYAIEAQQANVLVGNQVGAEYQDLIEIALGHLSQWFVDRTANYTQPFMVALTAEALIDYWETSHDPRVPPMLKLAADALWFNSWDRVHLCFNYYGDNGSIDSPSRDLNLLIAPLYGWVFAQTGLSQYRREGDMIFNAGVAGAWLGSPGAGGKQFSQNYRWSGKYVEWRKGPTLQSGTSPNAGHSNSAK